MTALIIIILIILYLFIGHFVLKVLDKFNTIDYDWIYEPAGWFFGLVFWCIVAIFIGTVHGVRWINKNIIDTTFNKFFELLDNVDISCCGVSINSYELNEHVRGAITHCFNKVFKVNNNAFMLTDRISMRTHKLLERGWEPIKEDKTKDELSCKQIIDYIYSIKEES